MFKDQPNTVPLSEVGVSTPARRYPRQPFDFRPPEHSEPPSWWQGSGCGECAGGGGFHGSSTLHRWWKDTAENTDFSVQVVAKDLIVGSETRRETHIEPKIRHAHFNAAQARGMAAALIEAADLLDDAEPKWRRRDGA